jgi:general secretion pathway protein K
MLSRRSWLECRPARESDGAALVSVILAVALLAGITAVFSHSVRLDLQARRHARNAVELEYLADGLAELVARRIASFGGSLKNGRPLPLNDTPQYCLVDDVRVRFSAVSAVGLVDLNAAPPKAFTRLFTGLGVDQARAEKVSAAIVQFRSADDGGVEAATAREIYASAGLSHGPKHGLFELVNELDQIPGMSASLLDRVWPYLTVHGQQQISAELAPIPLRRLMGATDGIALSSDAAMYFATGSGVSRSYHIRVLVSRGAIASFYRDAVMELSPRRWRGFEWRRWTRRSSPSEPTSNDEWAGAPPCIGELQ